MSSAFGVGHRFQSAARSHEATGLRLAAMAGVLTVLLTGCDKDPVRATGSPDSVRRAWIGTFTQPGGDGELIMDLFLTGNSASGEVVLGAPSQPHLFVRGGFIGDSLQLTGDGVLTDESDFMLRARILADSSLTGHILVNPSPPLATISCRLLPRRSVSSVSHTVPYGSKALLYDGQYVWMSTLGNDYILLTTDGQVADSVAIFYGAGLHWTSNALTFDGTRLWGALPGTVVSPQGSKDYSEILAFDSGGREPDSLRLWERTGGLAWNGSDFWSLRNTSSQLVRFDRTGTLLDSLRIGVPDPQHLEFDGSRFWTLGYYLKRLYEVDAQGRVVAICDLPEQEDGAAHGGLAVEGSHLWYAKNHGSYSTLYRLTID